MSRVIPTNSIKVGEGAQNVSQAVVHYCETTLEHWMYREHLTVATTTELRSKLPSFPVAIINHLHIEKPARGVGHGKRILKEIFRLTRECNTWILICDPQQTEDFDLKAWYERQGFQILESDQESDTPVMIKSAQRRPAVRSHKHVEVDRKKAA